MMKKTYVFLCLSLAWGCQPNNKQTVTPPAPFVLPSAQASASSKGTQPTPVPQIRASQLPAGPSKDNRPPIIQTLNANPNNTTDKDGLLSFTVNLLDPDGDPLNVRWKASSGSLSPEQGLNVQWRATDFDGHFQSGQTEIEVIADDGHNDPVTGKLFVLVDESGQAQVLAQNEASTNPKQIVDIQVNQDEFVLGLNETATLSANLVYDDGSTDNRQVYWESSQPQIVSINGRGEMIRHTEGEVIISVRTELSSGVGKRILVKDKPHSEASGSPTPAPSETPPNPSAPAQPALPTTGSVGTNNAEIRWTTVSGASSYYLYVNDQKLSNSFTGTSHILQNLQPATAYRVTVTAVNSAGESLPSTALNFTTQAPVPGAPANLRTTQVTPSQIALAWDSVAGASAYNLYLEGNPVALGVTGTSHTLTGLDSNTTYHLEISALNPTGESAKASLDVTTQSNIPTAPSNLQINNVQTTTAQLTWSGVPNASTYKVYLDSNFFAQSPGNQINLTGLLSGTEYNVEVTAANVDGESTPSNSVWMATQGVPGQLITRVYSNFINTTYFAISSTHLFFMNQSGQLKKVKIEGGEQSAFAASNQETIAQGYDFGVRDIQSDGSFVYFIHGSSLYKVSVNGGSVTTLAPTSASFQALRLEGDHVYWLDSGNSAIKKVSKSGGSVTTLASGISSLGSTLAVDSSAAYFVSGGLIRKVSTSGGSVSTLNAAQPSNTSKVAVAAGQLYWVAGLQGNGSYGLYKMSTSGGSFSKIVSHDVIGTAYDFEQLALYQNELYFTAAKKIYKTNSSGTSPTVFASYDSSPEAIAIDHQHVYFSHQGPIRGIKKVVK